MRVNHVGGSAPRRSTKRAVAVNAELKSRMAGARGINLSPGPRAPRQLSDQPTCNPLVRRRVPVEQPERRLGDQVSLGFVVETERQVGHHLERHLERLPAADIASRAIVVRARSARASRPEAGGVSCRRRCAAMRLARGMTNRPLPLSRGPCPAGVALDDVEARGDVGVLPSIAVASSTSRATARSRSTGGGTPRPLAMKCRCSFVNTFRFSCARGGLHLATVTSWRA